MFKQVFMIMPFGDSIAEQAYNCCVRKVCAEAGLTVRRADEIFTTNPIYDDIMQEIQTASVIIADISGRNANVFYELGVAHTLKQKQTVMLTHEACDSAPFDVAHFRIIQYENSIQGTRQLEEQLRKTLDILLQDLVTLHRAEFEVILRAFENAEGGAPLFSLIGLSRYPGVITRFEQLLSAGHAPETCLFTSAVTAEVGLAGFIKMGYVEVRGNVMVVTDLGRAFVSILEERGYVCDMINGHAFTPGSALPPGLRELLPEWKDRPDEVS